MMKRTHCPLFFTSLSITLLAVSLFGVRVPDAVAASTSTRTTALCSDVRTHVSVDSAGSESVTTYSGRELVTQDGDDATVEFLPDRLGGIPGTTIHYERITREDAKSLGLTPGEGMAVFMLHGDEGLPSEYVTLPEHMDRLPPSGRFECAYGSSRDDGGYDVTQLSCAVQP